MTKSYDQQLSDALKRFKNDPLGYVMFNWDWENEASIRLVELEPEYQKRFKCDFGPDLWACKFLDRLGEEIRESNFDGFHAVASTASL